MQCSPLQANVLFGLAYCIYIYLVPFTVSFKLMSCLNYYSVLKMETIYSCETFVDF
jgi:hypothetical protein